jgi:hypothetical protein
MIATFNLGRLIHRGMRQVDAKYWRASSSDWLQRTSRPTSQATEDRPRVEWSEGHVPDRLCVDVLESRPQQKADSGTDLERDQTH